jgi:hypothetical protein
MATDCMDLQTGTIHHFPRPGGWLDQDQLELDAIKIAWRTWRVFSRRQSKWTDNDKRFVDWMQGLDGDGT